MPTVRLFIDEAYYPYREDNERDYGQETIEILLQMMEDEREDLLVILAGYKDRMDAAAIEGLTAGGKTITLREQSTLPFAQRRD